MKKWEYLLFLLLLIVVASLVYQEGFGDKTTESYCKDRSSRSSCLNGYDKAGSWCYWCRNSGCIDPSDPAQAKYYQPKKCTSAKF